MKIIKRTFAHLTTLAAAAVCLFLFTACGGGIHRTAYICSSPSGAQCHVNGTYYGRTPVAMPYLWNWYYEINLDKEGYQPVKDTQYFKPAFYNRMPFDALMEIMPFPVFETKDFNYNLTPLSR